MCWTYSQRTPCCRLSVRVLACTSGIDMPWASVFGLQSAARTAATLLTLSAVCHLLCANPLAGALVVPFKDLSNLPQLSTVPAGLIRKRGVVNAVQLRAPGHAVLSNSACDASRCTPTRSLRLPVSPQERSLP